MQRTNSEYGSPYLATHHFPFPFPLLFMRNYSEWGLDSHEHASKTDTEEKDCWMKTVLLMSLNMSVALLSMQGQKALRLHQKYLHLCSKDEQRSSKFGTTWGWVINDRTFIFGWKMPLTVQNWPDRWVELENWISLISEQTIQAGFVN